MWASRLRKGYPSRCGPFPPSPCRRIPSPLSRQLFGLTAHRFYATSPLPSGPHNASSEHQDASIDVQHAEFVSAAKAKAPFQISDREKRGNSQGRLREEEGLAGTRTPDVKGKMNSGRDELPTNLTSEGTHPRALIGKLSPTSSHLFKLIVPLPPSLHAVLDNSSSNSTSSPRPIKVIDTAFLLHPSQPLSHVSRLILGSLPAGERDADVEFRAVSGREHAAYPTTKSEGSEEAEDAEGGPLLYERNPEGDDMQEVRWSTSTDLGDFIKQATLAKHFRIVLKPSWDAWKGQSNSQAQRLVIPTDAVKAESDTSGSSQEKIATTAETPELSLKIMIPSFDSRTRFLRKRLLYLTREISQLTQKKKELDKAAHRGARRIAVGGLMGLVGYWGVVFKLTFFTPNVGWDVMEPVTYLSGLSTLICSYLFFLYVGVKTIPRFCTLANLPISRIRWPISTTEKVRESSWIAKPADITHDGGSVSYSSVLDLSVSARQKILYEKAGLNIERWTEMVSEAKGLRREIQRVAQDYDYDWKGQLENLESDSLAPKGPPQASKDSQGSTSQGSEKVTTDTTTAQQVEATSLQSNTKAATPQGPIRHNEKKPLRQDSSDLQGIDIDATIDEAVELEEQTRLKDKQRKRGKGSKGEVAVEDKR